MFLNGFNSIDGANGRISSAALREMLLPSFINDDQTSGFGFPFEWFFLSDIKVWLITKGGAFPGYTAGMLMIPKLNFGVAALANNVDGDVLALEAASVFLPFLEQVLKANQPPPPNPGNLSSFVGEYISVYPPMPEVHIPIQISLSKQGTLQYDKTPLMWVQGNVFRMEPVKGKECFSMEIGSTFEFVFFEASKENPDEVISFVTPGIDPYFGVTFVKQNSSASSSP